MLNVAVIIMLFFLLLFFLQLLAVCKIMLLYYCSLDVSNITPTILVMSLISVLNHFNIAN